MASWSQHDNSLAFLGLLKSKAYQCGCPGGRVGRHAGEGRESKRLNIYPCPSCWVAQPCLTLSPHALQHARLLCPPPSPWVFSNSCQLVGYASQPPRTLLPPSPFAFNLSQHQGLFKELALCIRWPKSQSSSFSIGPSNEYSDWFPLGLTSLISFDIKYTNDNSTTIFHLESSINQMRRVKYCPKAEKYCFSPSFICVCQLTELSVLS